MRRIEAVTGAGALGYVRRLEGELRRDRRRLLRAAQFEVAARVAKLQAELREQRQGDREAAPQAGLGRRRAISSPRRATSDGVRVLATRADVADAKALRDVADQLRDKLRSGVIVLAGVEGDKIALVAMVTPDLVGKFNAGKIVGEVAKAVGGKGGGRADMAQGGGTRAAAPRRGAGARVYELVRG